MFATDELECQTVDDGGKGSECHKLIIDPELQSLIPLPTEAEYAQLEANILAEGCKYHLVAGRIADEDGPAILLDGHNRLEICQKNKIPYEVDIQNFQTREDAIVWMINNQLGRRNLPPLEISYLRGLRYNQEKARIRNPSGKNQHLEVCDQSDNKPRTSERLAKQFKCSPATIVRESRFADAVESLAQKAGPEARQKIISRQTGLTRKDVLLLESQLSSEEQQQILSGDAKQIKKKLKTIKDKLKPAKDDIKQDISEEPAEAGPEHGLTDLAPVQTAPVSDPEPRPTADIKEQLTEDPYCAARLLSFLYPKEFLQELITQLQRKIDERS